jgi:hypothetical protein
LLGGVADKALPVGDEEKLTLDLIDIVVVSLGVSLGVKSVGLLVGIGRRIYRWRGQRKDGSG